MAKARMPRTNNNPSNKQVITMPETGSLPQVRKTSPVNPTPIDLESQIRLRAYELYQQRGCSAGDEKEDWFQAEREIRARLSHQQSA